LRLLLDSHIAYWLALKRSELSSGERTILFDADNALAVSAVTVWELRIKWEKRSASGERKGEVDPIHLLNILRRLNVPLIPLDPEIAAVALNAPMPHKDPFDEMLLIQAQELGMRLLTRDGDLADHPSAFTAP
jgi:PIN domain nuclease of toxin-antitoxin system